MQRKLPGKIETVREILTLYGSQDLLASHLDPETLKSQSGAGMRRHRLEVHLSESAP